jgi:hypothetical protein
MRSRLFLRLAALVLVGAVVAGCASEYVKVAPKPPDQYTRLGPAKGSACGALGFVINWASFVPMGLNSRIERAYANAVASVPGATGLVDVTLEESWAWWIVVTSRCTTVSGVAIK